MVGLTVPDERPFDHSRYHRARRVISGAQANGVDGVPGVLLKVCHGLTVDLGVSGVAVSLMTERVLAGVAAASSDWARHVDDLQFTTGEGPCHDAFAARRPVLTPDLRHVPGNPWPGYAPSAIAEGVIAVFAFPLHVGASGFGVMDVYADRPGSLSTEQETTALTFARIATEVLLDGALSDLNVDLDEGLATTLDYRAEVHQAQGMVMIDLGIDAADALARMRARAFAHDEPLIDLARSIIAGAPLPEDD